MPIATRPAVGIAGQAHEALPSQRAEALAVLYVDVAHPRVQDMYERWSYEKVGEHRPFEGAPLYAVMIRTLR
ncbi:acetyltransferase [Kitasatospora sp. NPDC059146]|uniref:acetyltransferase n=1 Tax=unclassified Kitasatospora TaxID=2633591 RepID=UPI0036BD4741